MVVVTLLCWYCCLIISAKYHLVTRTDLFVIWKKSAIIVKYLVEGIQNKEFFASAIWTLIPILVCRRWVKEISFLYKLYIELFDWEGLVPCAYPGLAKNKQRRINLFWEKKIYIKLHRSWFIHYARFSSNIKVYVCSWA